MLLLLGQENARKLAGTLADGATPVAIRPAAHYRDVELWLGTEAQGDAYLLHPEKPWDKTAQLSMLRALGFPIFCWLSKKRLAH